MKTRTFRIGLFVAMLVFVVAGFVLGATVFRFEIVPILIYTLGGAAIFAVASRVVQRRVQGVLDDERGRMVTGRAAFIAFRSYLVAGWAGITVLWILSDRGVAGAGPAIGVLGLSLGLISAVFSIAYFSLNRRS